MRDSYSFNNRIRASARSYTAANRSFVSPADFRDSGADVPKASNCPGQMHHSADRVTRARPSTIEAPMSCQFDLESIGKKPPRKLMHEHAQPPHRSMISPALAVQQLIYPILNLLYASVVAMMTCSY